MNSNIINSSYTFQTFANTSFQTPICQYLRMKHSKGVDEDLLASQIIRRQEVFLAQS